MIIDGWYCCPIHKNRIQQIAPDSVYIDANLYCKMCKQNHKVTIVKGQVIAPEPIQKAI